MSPSNASSTGGANANGESNNRNCIEHKVSKMDTLAGVAIKYGVEVADIKRLNGLSTDLQMFALKSLLIPLPGRHPPSPILSNGSASLGGNGTDKTKQLPRQSNVSELFESLRLKSPRRQKVSPAMNSLQKYYGLKSSKHKGAAEGTEMAVYRTGSSDTLYEGLLHKPSPSGTPYCSNKSRNLANGFFPDNDAFAEYSHLAEAGDGDGDKSNEKSVRRRQKVEADSRAGTPERLLKQENSGGSSDFSPATGKGLAMRPKSSSRMTLTTESEPGWVNSIPVGLGDSIMADGLAGFRKSSSTPSLHDQDNSNSASVWSASKWSLKPDFQVLSTTAITIPIFDGIPKPTGRRNKAALD